MKPCFYLIYCIGDFRDIQAFCDDHYEKKEQGPDYQTDDQTVEKGVFGQLKMDQVFQWFKDSPKDCCQNKHTAIEKIDFSALGVAACSVPDKVKQHYLED